MKRTNQILRIVFLAMMVAVGVVISPILRVEGMCPTQHLINVVCSVLMGPWFSLLCATLIGLIRMTVMGIPPLALTGAVFGAFLSGVLYRASKGNILCAVIGEVIGTGVIGAIVSYPVMAFLLHRGGLTWFFYVPTFLLATVIGGSVAYLFLRQLSKMRVLCKMQSQLSGDSYGEEITPMSNAAAIVAVGVILYLVIKILTTIIFSVDTPMWDWVANGAVILFGCIGLIYGIVHRDKKAVGDA